MKKELLKILDQFKNKKILVIGDIMLDKYIIGDVSRISPEAPIQIVNITAEDFAPGGAANVAANIAALNGKVLIAGVVGNDFEKDALISELKERGIEVKGIIIEKRKPTTQKVRILSRGQQLLRLDYEKKEESSKATISKLLDFVSKQIRKCDALVISDYAKGVITRALMKKVICLAKKNNKTVIVDPKPEHIGFYKNADVITPNNKEACEIAGIETTSEKDIIKAGRMLLKKLNSNVLITMGEKGMLLFEKSGKLTNIPTKAKEVYDVTGAGDTVVATFTLALAAGASIKDAAILANHAGGIVVGKIGTSTVSIDEIKRSLKNGK